MTMKYMVIPVLALLAMGITTATAYSVPQDELPNHLDALNQRIEGILQETKWIEEQIISLERTHQEETPYEITPELVTKLNHTRSLVTELKHSYTDSETTLNEIQFIVPMWQTLSSIIGNYTG